MQDLKITLIQSDIHWHNIEANLMMFEEKISQISDPTDLILLPEMFNTGFTMSVEQMSETMDDRTFQWMKRLSAQTNSLLIGSLIIEDEGRYFNRLIWMEPDGTFDFYDKRHLFRMADEEKYYSSGKKILIKEWKGWKICPLICYDLRFPVWSRNKADQSNGKMNYDLNLFIANWPAARSNAWDVLLKARAVENLCYTAGLNRVGKDGKDIEYNGHSAVIDPKGDYIFYNENEEIIQTVTLDYDNLQSYRKKFPAYLDADQFEVKM